MCTALEVLPQLVREAADVGALGAMHAETRGGFGVLTELVRINMNRLGLALDGLAIAGELIKRHTIFFNGGNHRRFLLDVAGEFSRGEVECVAVEWRHRRGVGYFALGVIAVGGLSEMHCAFVDLVVGSEFL